MSLKTEGDVNNSHLRNQWSARHSIETAELLKRDAHIFLHQSLSTPCLDVLQSADSATIEAVSGAKYLDFHGNSVHQGGFGNQFVTERIKAAMEELPFSSRRFTNRWAIECAEKLVSYAPRSLSRVLFSPSGSIVNGIALKIARLVTGKHKVVSFWDSFHGAGLDMIAVGGEAQFKQQMGPMMSGVFHLPWPDKNGPFGPRATELEYANYFEYIVEKEGDIAAFIAEPFRSTEVRIPSTHFWQRIRAICDKHRIVLIMDEIPTALYRSGTFFAFEQCGIVPDIVTLGKGLGGGIIPFAAMLCREDFNQAAHISLGHYTHEKSPLGAAAALGLFDWFEQVSIEKRVQQIHTRFLDSLKALDSPYIREIRAVGALFGLELQSDALAEQVLYQSLERGLSYKVSGGTTLTLAPPLSITEEELDRAANILSESLNALT